MISTGIDLSNYSNFRLASEVSLLFNPLLEEIGIDYFCFVKVYHHDGSRMILTNNPQWIKHFYGQGYYREGPVIKAEYFQETGHYNWCDFIDLPTFKDGRESFNLFDGITLVKKHQSTTHIYCFGAHKNSINMLYFLREHQELLHRFIVYFHEQANHLIEKAEHQKIEVADISYKYHYLQSTLQHVNNEKIERFLQKSMVKKLFIDSSVYITNKEAVCLLNLIQGKTAKQTAKELGISYRTVETHLHNVKNKLNCHDKQKLIQLLLDKNFNSVINSALLDTFYLKELSEGVG